jgi:hypothetical protein
MDWGSYPSPEGIVDLGQAERVSETSVEVASGLIVENPPEDPAALAARLAGPLGQNPRKARR